MSKKAADAGTQSYDYYGTIAGIICLGPVLSLNRVVIDDKVVWTGPLTRDSDPYEDVDISGYGILRIYWGTDAQTVDYYLQSAHNDRSEQHPDYKGVCYIVLINFLFGRERTTAPNIQVEVSRAPNQSIITGAASGLDDGQANCAAVLAEMATSPRGLGLPTTRLNSTVFQSAANSLHAIADRAAVSVLLTSQATFKAFAEALSGMADVWLRQKDNLLELIHYPHGSAPSASTALAMSQLTERPKFTAGGWLKAATSAIIEFEDRDLGYKRSGDRMPDLRALQGAGQDQPLSITLDHVTRRTQALAIAAETLRSAGQPQLDGTISVRREHGRNILVGSWVVLDIDLEPGGAMLSQFFRVKERRIPHYGPIELSLDADETLTPLPYTPSVSAPSDTPPIVPAIVHARIMEAPGALTDGITDAIVVLAERPTELLNGLECWFDTATDGDFAILGTQVNFATRATLRTDLTTSATTIEVANPGQIDSDRFALQPGALAASNDTLLAIVLQIDSGQIDEATDGSAIMEICSISAITNPSGSNYNLTVLRGRRGTSVRAFATATAEVWIMPRNLLVPFIHAKHAELRRNRAEGDTPDTAYYRLAATTYFASRDIEDCASIAFKFPLVAPNAPNIILSAPASLPVTLAPPYPKTVTVTGTWTDLDANMVQWQVFLRKDGSSDVLVREELFGATSGRAFSVPVVINEAGTFYVTCRAFDATGISGEKIFEISAGTGTGKVSTPELTIDGVSVPAGTMSDVFGLCRLSCATSGATIKWRYDGAVSWTTYDAADVTKMPRVGQGATVIETYATKTSFTDSDTAEWTFDNSVTSLEDETTGSATITPTEGTVPVSWLTSYSDGTSICTSASISVNAGDLLLVYGEATFPNDNDVKPGPRFCTCQARLNWSGGSGPLARALSSRGGNAVESNSNTISLFAAIVAPSSTTYTFRISGQMIQEDVSANALEWNAVTATGILKVWRIRG